MHWTDAIRHDPEAIRTFREELANDLSDASLAADRAILAGDLTKAAAALGRKLCTAELIERVIRAMKEGSKHAA